MDSPKPLIFVLTFLGVFAVLFNAYVSSGWITATEIQGIDYRESYELNQFYGTSFQSYDNHSVSVSPDVDYQLPNVIGANNLSLTVNMYFTDDTLNTYAIAINQYWYDTYWIVPFLQISHFNPNPINRTYFVSHISDVSSGKEASIFTMYNKFYTVTCVFTYNEALYSSLESAWDHGHLNLLIGYNLANVTNYSPDVWALFGQLMTFQAPDIHPLLNAVIAIPLWVLVVYIVWQIIVSFIP